MVKVILITFIICTRVSGNSLSGVCLIKGLMEDEGRGERRWVHLNVQKSVDMRSATQGRLVSF